MSRPAACALLVVLAGRAVADDPVPPPVPVLDTLAIPASTVFGGADAAGGAARGTSVESLAPPRAALTTRWRLKPFMGPSTVRLGGLDTFPQAAITILKYNNAPFTDQQRHDIAWAFLEGAEGSYLIDPLVRVAGKLAWLRSEVGTTHATGAAAGYRNEDWWSYQTEVLFAMAGAGFILPVEEHTRAVVGLFLGAGLGTVRIDHRTLKSYPSGHSDLEQAAAEGRGTGFFPEFSLEIEHDLTPSLAAEATLGYRFGGIGTFKHQYDTSVNGFGPYTESRKGQAIRDAGRQVLDVDYGGLFLAVSLAARL